ncbi:MAG: hypothetical protein IKP23_05190 [Elusimicrobiaceae bacterium]|nr:hypothetical protein [Elusimicrobiaceae bacterium]
MLKKITALILFLLCSISIFAQIPPSSGYDKEEKPLVYIPSRDYKEPQYMWGLLYDYKTDYNKHYGLSWALVSGRVLFTITEDGIREKPTNISNKELAEKNALENELNKNNRQKELSNMITNGFQIWFSDTKAAIEKAGRQQEFADIMPILNKSVTPISDTSRQYERDYRIPVVNFHFTTENKMHSICGNYEAAACEGSSSFGADIISVHPYTTQKSEWFSRNQIKLILIHEIGHYYGLADQYRDAAWNADKEYSTKDRIKDGSSVMASGYTSHLKCDDIDGFINLIDFTLAKQNDGNFSKRAQKGWASFCNGKGYKNTYYKMAKPFSAKGLNNPNNEPSSNSQIKPFTFYSSQHKYDFTYNRNDLMATKKDDQYSYKYSYYKNNGIPTIKVSAAGKEFFAVKKDRNAWELPVGYAIKEEKYNTRHYINVNANQCDIVNYIPFSDKKSYSVSYKDGKLQAEYTYSLPLGKEILELHKYETLGHPVCLVKTQYDTEVIKLVGSTFDNIESMAGVSRNQYILDDIANAEGKTRREIIDTLKTECRKTLHHSITTNTKELCSYFKKVDNYFNK